MLVKAQIPIGQVILFVVVSLRNGDAASIEVAADISALLDKVGLKGPKLAAVREMKKALHGSWQLSWSRPEDRAKDAAEVQIVREEPMGIEKMLPNSVRVVVPKKGKKKKVVKLGPCGDKAVAGTKLLQVV